LIFLKEEERIISLFPKANVILIGQIRILGFYISFQFVNIHPIVHEVLLPFFPGIVNFSVEPPAWFQHQNNKALSESKGGI
ncbi:MAG: hypothetical protein Q8O47_08410, partial [Candidatus Bathyarchaeota archaeon]|nr:hypothetical protein [Candidatus Bathyarchaeota archaeon]